MVMLLVCDYVLMFYRKAIYQGIGYSRNIISNREVIFGEA